MGMWISLRWIEADFSDGFDGLISLAGRAGGNSRHKAEALRQLIRILTLLNRFPEVSKMAFFSPLASGCQKKITRLAQGFSLVSTI